MKGLTLNCLGRKEEAYEYVRRGLRNDLKSHVCWHVYGLLQRSDHKYDEAIKCYRNALKWDKDNIQILRDLSLLQVQMRDLEGYRDTRSQLLHLRPTQRASWIGYAMAYHLLGDYEIAANILEEFRKTTSNAQNKGVHRTNNSKSTTIDYEQSELILYQVMVYKEGGCYEDALEHLTKYGESEVCDKLAVHEYRAELLLKLKKNTEAAKVLRENLIARNPENTSYYKQLEVALGLSEFGDANNNKDNNNSNNSGDVIEKENLRNNGKTGGNVSMDDFEDAKLKLYKEFQQLYPKAQMPFRMPLTFIMDEKKFEKHADLYIKKSLRKGQPALFRDLKSLYALPKKCSFSIGDDFGAKSQSISSSTASPPSSSYTNKYVQQPIFKRQVVEKLFLKYHDNLIRRGYFESEDSSDGPEDATTILWVDYYLAQHFDYLGNYEDALKYINIALSHTPTLIELYVIKGKIYKHAGNIEEAVSHMEEAQSLDTADRYLNSKCAKYLLRADRIREAEEMCSKFTREGVSASDNLNEMQCMWYQNEAAKSHQRLGKWGESLKKCIEIDRHFAEITEDQFDFHTYCMRKMTLRSYVGLLKLEDVLKSHAFYFDAAKTAIEVYLGLYDKPLGDEEVGENINPQGVSASEYKKMMSKQRKAKKKAEAKKEQGSTTISSTNVSTTTATTETTTTTTTISTSPTNVDSGNVYTNSSDNNSHHQNHGHPNHSQSHSHSQNSNSSVAVVNSGEKSDGNNSSSNPGKESTGNEMFNEKLIPSKLERPDDPLEEAIKFLKPLQMLDSNRISTHLMAFEIYYRQEKVMLMLQSLKRAVKLNPNDPIVHRQLALFYDFVERNREKLSQPIRQVLKLEMDRILNLNTDELKSALQLNEKLLETNKDSLVHRLESLKVIAMLKRVGNKSDEQQSPNDSENDDNKENKSIGKSKPPTINHSQDENYKNYLNSLNINLQFDDLERLTDVTLESCIDLIKCLKEGILGSVNGSLIENIVNRCHKLFPYASAFLPINPSEQSTSLIQSSGAANSSQSESSSIVPDLSLNQ